ncbi:putative phage abortive infection protein [Acinetobacter baumannii]|uniref:Phage abortive infection protein n=5 Tax=Acinetobacter calcoaceticus/baumannii complex TaxID=909768 RepID=A0A429LGS9_ACIBA|nr:putative phage abortive infection protein [Acinetobacter baumannii]MBF6953886.1 hypothetical protein [Acinetobacter baumannii]RSP77469.1 hypothetical protein EA722_07340 [Acinetobacter baumannii]HAV5485131.1 hypothetical protein [Acinetobacter baumannii]
MQELENNSDKDLEKIDQDISLHRILVFLIIIVVLFFYLIMLDRIKISSEVQNWGTIGDFFGGILNPIFALFAFYWLTYSVRLQIKELKETRNELKKAAKAQEDSARHQEEIARLEAENVKTQNNILNLNIQTLKEQKSAAIAQKEQIAIQNFESLFFQLLQTKTKVTNDILMGSTGTLYKFAKENIGFADIKIKTMKDKGNSLNGKESIKDHIILFKTCVEKNWEEFYTSSFLDLAGSYFRISYQIVKLIDQNDNLYKLAKVKDKDYSIKQKEYFDIFRSTFTQYELEAFFFNCLYKYGNDKFKKLIEKYGMFEPLLIDYDRSNESIHSLTRYAYQYNEIIFEENELWKEYFEKVENLKKVNRKQLSEEILKLYYLDILPIRPDKSFIIKAVVKDIEKSNTETIVDFILKYIDQTKRLNIKNDISESVVKAEVTLKHKYREKEFPLSEDEKRNLSNRINEINSIEYIDEISFILASRIYINEFFEYFKLRDSP